VRTAFKTRHSATIRDSAGEIWLRISEKIRETAFFVVADPQGAALASLNPADAGRLPPAWPIGETLRRKFPGQVAGVAVLENQLYQLILTPVYIDSVSGPSLLCVLVTGYTVNHKLALRLRQSTGSDFIFESGDRIFASTLNARATEALHNAMKSGGNASLASDGISEYVPLQQNLVDLSGNAVGSLHIFRSFDAARESTYSLQRTLVFSWLAAIALSLVVSYSLARRIVEPVRMLDRAAGEVSRQNYEFRIESRSNDELGRLARTFNTMCDSIQKARQELIRQERISTIGRLASSIVHDLRNPLAAIYGGAEMLVDTHLSEPQVKRIAANIYNSSRRIQQMLSDLLQVTRGGSGQREICMLDDLLQGVLESFEQPAAAQNVSVSLDVPSGLEVQVERSRLERAFANLIGNALEVMPGGGRIAVTAGALDEHVEIRVEDTGPGISPQLRSQLFQPFVTYGKKDGLGLGLALARQTVLDQGGDIWADEREGGGARFCVRLPLLSAAPVR